MQNVSIGKFACLAITALLLLAACRKTPVATNVPGAVVNPADMSYTDLKPGGQLRILVPVLKNGGYQPSLDAMRTEGATITLSASNLVGYETSYYAIEARRGGRVRLRFASAEISKDGKSTPEQQAPQLPFPLPEKAQYVRLLYLIRSSRADHNMAIIGAGDRQMLARFTTRLKDDPQACEMVRDVFCTWVPAGIAVRPQKAGESN
ncbi:MAG TPA: hypothetical protein VKX25_08010 [Bryobacteraceae bacterium]|nr:hypothetical protein [Bryobacteraceae bacterium]